LRLARDSPSTEAEVDTASRERRYNLTVQDMVGLGGGGCGEMGRGLGRDGEEG